MGVSGSRLQIVSGQGTPTVTIRGNACGNEDLYVTRYKNGVSACADTKTILVNGLGCGIIGPGGGKCSASVRNIWCSQYNNNGYNSLIDVSANVTNPYVNTAQVEVTFDPNYWSGLQLAGGTYNISGNQSTIIPSQFAINASNGSPSGFFVPIIVRYTDLTTGATCTVNLNPLVQGCSGSPARLAQPGSIELGDDPAAVPVEMQLYDLSGKKVMDRKVEGDLPELSSPHSGLHILHIRRSDGSTEKHKVMLETP